ncbi:MAG: flagellin [Chloroflexi bacterium]|nr:flagellin [Chloroflexota bacterium]
MRVNTNVAALTAMRNLTTVGTQYTKSVEKLSSGLRINRAGDDAAGLSISEKMRAQIKGINQASRNAQDAISMIQTAEGALTEVHSMLQRMRELAVQFANDTLTSDDRDAIVTELNELSEEIDATSDRTTFNEQFLLKGALDNAATAVDTHQNSELQKGSFDANILVTDITYANDDAEDTYFFSYDAANDLLTAVRQSDGATASYDTTTSTLVAPGDTDSFTLDFATGTDPTFALEALAGFTDVDDIGTLLTTAATNSLRTALTGGDKTAQYQVGPNSADVFTVDFDEVTANSLTFNIGALDPGDSSTAAAFIDEVDADITTVSTVRSTLGAGQNRLEHAIANLGVASENMTAAESRIRDLDMAQESVNFTRLQILQQAGVSVLAQANASPQTVLLLLQ